MQLVLEPKSIMSTVGLYLVKSLVPVAGVAPTVKTRHVLIRVWVPIIMFLGQDVLLLLRSSKWSWLLLLVYHEGCLRRLVLIRIIEVIRSVICVKRVLPIFERLLRLWLLIVLHNGIFWSPCQIINGLLLVVWKRIDWTIDSWFRIFQVVTLTRKL